MKTQISMYIHAGWSEPSLFAWIVYWPCSIQKAYMSEWSDSVFAHSDKNFCYSDICASLLGLLCPISYGFAGWFGYSLCTLLIKVDLPISLLKYLLRQIYPYLCSNIIMVDLPISLLKCVVLNGTGTFLFLFFVNLHPAVGDNLMNDIFYF